MKTFTITERPDLKTSEIMDEIRKNKKVWSYYDDDELDKQFPTPKEPTFREFLDTDEPDPETLGLSVREVEKKFGTEGGITLRERLLMELVPNRTWDIKGVTFCSGSRYSDGNVPFVSFGIDSSNSEYGVRRAVSLDSFSLNPSIEQGIETVKGSGYVVYKKM